jgi:ribosome maturation factor RimP
MTGIGEKPIPERVRALLEPVVAGDGFELVEVEWLREGGSWVLRLYVDRPGGVNLEHCQDLSRTVETILDVEDVIGSAYHLEVSSPGVERPLRKPVDGGHGPRKSFTGVLRGFRDGAVEIEVDGALHRIPHDKIAKASLEHDFEADLRRKE